MMGSLVSGQLLVPLGPRVTILIGLPVGMAAWLGLTFLSQLWIFMLCRFLLGCTFALVKQPSIIYIVEATHESLRGKLVGILCIARELGIFSSYLLSSLMLTWRQLSLVYACIMIPPMIGVFFIPSSPRWLTTHGHVDEARKSLVFFRGRHYNVEAELLDVVRQAEDVGSSSNTWQQLKLLTRPRTLQMFLLVFAFFIISSINGTSVLNTYLVILLNTPGTPLNVSVASFLCGISKIAGTISTLITIDYFGRVPILVVSASFISVCTSAYCYFFYFLKDYNTDSVTWLPLVSIVAMLFLSGAFIPVIDVLQGELLPNACRAVSMPLISLFNGLSVFAVVQLFPQLMEMLGRSGVFGIFTAVNLALALLSIVAVPETRGMSLEAISDALHYEKAKQNVMKEADDVSLTSLGTSKSV